MNVFVPLFIIVVAVCWFLVYTGRVAPTDPRLLLCVGGAVAGGAVFFLYVYARAGRERADAMRRVAEGLGWEFAERLPVGALPGADRFQIFTGEAVPGAGEESPRPLRWDTRRVAENVLRGEAGGAEVFVFDLLTRHIVRPAGAAGRGSNAETVVCARVPGAGLPRFALAPKGFWPWLSRLAGGADVEVSSRPGLARLYSLRGDDEGAVRRLFEAPALASFFEAREAFCVEGEGDRLVFYRHGASLPPERLRPFIDETLEAVKLFKAAQA
ncbi:MAG TPA: hypothetical protein VFS10_19015 [Pyrinomonadaceae bacterium]|nr:hypothetical protein [Pyrinomonadaceae bacterium]